MTFITVIRAGSRASHPCRLLLFQRYVIVRRARATLHQVHERDEIIQSMNDDGDEQILRDEVQQAEVEADESRKQRVPRRDEVSQPEGDAGDEEREKRIDAVDQCRLEHPSKQRFLGQTRQQRHNEEIQDRALREQWHDRSLHFGAEMGDRSPACFGCPPCPKQERRRRHDSHDQRKPAYPNLAERVRPEQPAEEDPEEEEPRLEAGGQREEAATLESSHPGRVGRWLGSRKGGAKSGSRCESRLPCFCGTMLC